MSSIEIMIEGVDPLMDIKAEETDSVDGCLIELKQAADKYYVTEDPLNTELPAQSELAITYTPPPRCRNSSKRMRHSSSGGSTADSRCRQQEATPSHWEEEEKSMKSEGLISESNIVSSGNNSSLVDQKPHLSYSQNTQLKNLMKRMNEGSGRTIARVGNMVLKDQDDYVTIEMLPQDCETEEEKKKRLKREYDKMKRAQWSHQDWQRAREMSRQRYLERRALETEAEQRRRIAIRSELSRLRREKMKLTETPEQRELRLQKNRLKQREKRSKMTDEQKRRRQEKEKERRRHMSAEQVQKRRESNARASVKHREKRKEKRMLKRLEKLQAKQLQQYERLVEREQHLQHAGLLHNNY